MWASYLGTRVRTVASITVAGGSWILREGAGGAGSQGGGTKDAGRLFSDYTKIHPLINFDRPNAAKAPPFLSPTLDFPMVTIQRKDRHHVVLPSRIRFRKIPRRPNPRNLSTSGCMTIFAAKFERPKIVTGAAAQRPESANGSRMAKEFGFGLN